MAGPRDCHTEWSKSDREGEISHDIPYMWNLKGNYAKELMKQKETHRQREWTSGCQRGRDSYSVWDRHVHIATFKTGNQQGPTLQYMELSSTSRGKLGARGARCRMGICTCMPESLFCSPDTITSIVSNC